MRFGLQLRLSPLLTKMKRISETYAWHHSLSDESSSLDLNEIIVGESDSCDTFLKTIDHGLICDAVSCIHLLYPKEAVRNTTLKCFRVFCWNPICFRIFIYHFERVTEIIASSADFGFPIVSSGLRHQHHNGVCQKFVLEIFPIVLGHE